MSNKNGTAIIIAVVGFAALALGCFTTLVAFGKDPSSLTNFTFLLIPNTIGLVILTNKVSNVEKDTGNIRTAVNGQLDAKLNDIKKHVTKTVEGQDNGN